MMRQILACLPLVLSIALSGCDTKQLNSNSSNSSNKTLRVWWSEGYYPEETEAIKSVVNTWKTQTKSEVELTFYSEKDLIQQAQNAIAAGNPPDIIYGYSISLGIVPQLAWKGQLADVSSIITPLEKDYSPEALKSVFYFNNQDKKRSYYAVPLSQQTTHIHYWKDILEESGSKSTAIPKDWAGFWQFWQTGQNNLRKKGITQIYAFGLPMSTAATDTFTIFEQFLEAYNVQLLDDQGNPRFEQPEERAKIIQALKAYTQHYTQNYVPPGASTWGDPDNNVTFLSQLILMTLNGSMSIPGSQRQDEATYHERMRTIPWPTKPDGSPMRHVTSVKQVAILGNSNHLDQAKSLVAFLVQPKNLNAYVEGAQGRFFPVMPAMLKRPFWTNPKDNHIFVAAQQFQNTVPSSYVTLNPAYSEVQSQNIWGEAIYRIAVEKVPVEKAADTAISKMQTIFTEWK